MTVFISVLHCVFRSLLQGNIFFLLRSISLVLPLRGYLHDRKQFLNIINVESDFPSSATVSRDTRLAKLQRRRCCWPWTPMKRKSAVLAKTLSAKFSLLNTDLHRVRCIESPGQNSSNL